MISAIDGNLARRRLRATQRRTVLVIVFYPITQRSRHRHHISQAYDCKNVLYVA